MENKLTTEEVQMYEKISGSKIDQNKKDVYRHKHDYYVVNNKGQGRWWSLEKIREYLSFKFKSVNNTTNNNINNNIKDNIIHNVNTNRKHIKISKEKTASGSITLKVRQWSRIKAIAAEDGVSVSKAIGFAIDETFGV